MRILALKYLKYMRELWQELFYIITIIIISSSSSITVVVVVVVIIIFVIIICIDFEFLTKASHRAKYINYLGG